MTTIGVKVQESASSLPLNLSSSPEEAKISFSELLKGTHPKKDDKIIQNGTLVLSLQIDQRETGENSKLLAKDTPLSLLNIDEKVAPKEKEPLEINPKIIQSLSAKEVKSLIQEAKEYLKKQIVQSDGYKDAQIKELPKTLKGLLELSQKIGIDISKITIEELEQKQMKAVEPNNILKEEKKPQVQNDAKELKSSFKEQAIDKEAKTTVATRTQEKNQAVIMEESKKIQTPKQAVVAKETPLFKAQNKSDYTTEQLVASKQYKAEEKSPKSRADETLKLLLRGEKPSLVGATGSALTADFSVETAKVIAPTVRNDSSKSLENLLRGESGEISSNASKIEGLALKPDSFEIKLNEAKQMIKYLSQDVKTAIEDYKSPFTRVKVQLSPQKLGEVDVTIVQRGKNLHITLGSNSTAIHTLSMNANELRVQLQNNGINNASLNFNSQDSSHSSAGQQEQHRQKEQQAKEEYASFGKFEHEEYTEEILSSLEIIVPNYV